MENIEYKTRKESVYQHYESQWEGYTEEDVLKRVKNLANVMDAIISNLTLKDGMKILDLGSGPGILPLRLAQVFGEEFDFEMYGIDISEEAIQLGNKVIEKNSLSKSIHLIKGDAENLPFLDLSFDAVVSNATINLLLDKEKGFDEIARITKDGGRVVIADCITKKEKCGNHSDNNGRLWSACVSGAPTKEEFFVFAEQTGLEVFDSKDLTDEVSRLVKNKLWDWPEFLEYELDYYVFGMRKVNRI